jgi:hypothetical protein
MSENQRLVFDAMIRERSALTNSELLQILDVMSSR